MMEKLIKLEIKYNDRPHPAGNSNDELEAFVMRGVKEFMEESNFAPPLICGMNGESHFLIEGPQLCNSELWSILPEAMREVFKHNDVERYCFVIGAYVEEKDKKEVVVVGVCDREGYKLNMVPVIRDDDKAYLGEPIPHGTESSFGDMLNLLNTVTLN